MSDTENILLGVLIGILLVLLVQHIKVSSEGLVGQNSFMSSLYVQINDDLHVMNDENATINLIGPNGSSISKLNYVSEKIDMKNLNKADAIFNNTGKNYGYIFYINRPSGVLILLGECNLSLPIEKLIKSVIGKAVPSISPPLDKDKGDKFVGLEIWPNKLISHLYKKYNEFKLSKGYTVLKIDNYYT